MRRELIVTDLCLNQFPRLRGSCKLLQNLRPVRLKDYRQAIRDSDRAIEPKSKITGTYVQRGIAYYKLGDYRMAIRDYDRAIDLDPKDAIAYYNRGVAYHNLSDYLEAISDYKTAARMGSKLAQSVLIKMGVEW